MTLHTDTPERFDGAREALRDAYDSVGPTRATVGDLDGSADRVDRGRQTTGPG